MGYLFFGLFGFAGGVIWVYFAVDAKRTRLEAQRVEQDIRAEALQQSQDELTERARLAEKETSRLRVVEAELSQEMERLQASRSSFEASVISYKELQDENAILKKDLRNIDVLVRKTQLDRELQRQTQEK